jgi:hypothetical protein
MGYGKDPGNPNVIETATSMEKYVSPFEDEIKRREMQFDDKSRFQNGASIDSGTYISLLRGMHGK